MKHWMLSLLMVLGTALAFGQQEYFIYLQTDNHQPFYVRLNNKVYSSAESGYLIIPRLSDSTYQFLLGFPGNIFPEQTFSTAVNHKDAGYLVKDFGDKGWGLFNLQTMAVTPAGNASAEKKSPEINVTKKTDAFSALLANAVNDSSILYVTSYPAHPAAPVVKKKVSKDTIIMTASPAEEKHDTVVVAKTVLRAIDSAAIAKKEPVEKIDTLKPEALAPEQKTATNKVAELLTDTSYIAVYTDGTTEKFDTIRISIPLDKPGIQMAEAKASGKTPVYNMPGTGTQKDTIELSPKNNITEQKPVPPAKDSAKTLVTDSTQAPEKSVDTIHLATHQPDTLRTEVAAKTAIPNSNCKNIAWDSDIDKLRVKMLSVKNDDDKIVAAKKVFKQKCLTVKQVKALSELFVTDEGKYKWFDASYPSVSDVADFRQLGELIKDNYYQSRFKAMLRK